MLYVLGNRMLRGMLHHGLAAGTMFQSAYQAVYHFPILRNQYLSYLHLSLLFFLVFCTFSLYFCYSTNLWQADSNSPIENLNLNH